MMIGALLLILLPVAIQATCYPQSCNILPCASGFSCVTRSICSSQQIGSSCQTRTECCSSTSTTNRASQCQQPMHRGPCPNSFTRYYFDTTAGVCRQFIYGGCQANQNNFESMQACMNACPSTTQARCEQPKKPGTCFGHFNRFYFHKASGVCRHFIYGGCHGNQNNFMSMLQCMTACRSSLKTRCEQPMKAGPCRAYIPRYYFDRVTGVCRQFTYGGCQGNQNNFRTLQECTNACSSTTRARCEQPMKAGPCQAYIPRYYFDRVAGVCKQFTYGGCQGNQNNFMSMQECTNACRSTTRDICQLPQEGGLCHQILYRYHYDSTTRTCSRFVYTGCNGNANNFETKQQCEQTCRPVQSRCDQPAETGPCYAYFQRYFFNKAAGVCQVFVYGGCQGNQNNFETMQACMNACPSNSRVTTKKAICHIRPDPSSYPKLSGSIEFIQPNAKQPILIRFNLLGFSTSTNQYYGVRIHTYGDIATSCAGAGEYFNPPGRNSRAGRYIGDGNMTPLIGRISSTMTDSVNSLFGENSIMGRSVVINSGVSGNAGIPLACCVIAYKQ